jgi:hypothetical protein
LATNIVEVQTLGGIVLLGGDFNARIAMLPNTINIKNLCELLQAPELAKTKQPSVVAKRQNRDANVGSWGHELLDLCCDVRLFILNGQTHGDELREFICSANGGCNTIDYIIGSPAIWQADTHLKVIIDDTPHCTMGGDSDHKPLCLGLSIDCNFVKPQHTVVTKKILRRFKYDKSKIKKYQLALKASLGNLWVVNLIRHLG